MNETESYPARQGQMSETDTPGPATDTAIQAREPADTSLPETDTNPGARFAPDPNQTETGQAETPDRGPGLIRDMDRFRRSWESVQVGFVDNPRHAVQEAAALVEEVIEELSAGLRHQIDSLTPNGDQAGETEAMRRAFTRYRDFFDRLLGARL